MQKGKRLHFLLIYPLQTAPSQRFRFEQFFPVFEKQGFQVTANCFYDTKTFSILYDKKGKSRLALRVLACFLRRCFHLFTLSQYDYILIQRGAAPFGPPVFEWVIRYIYRKPIIYDFDDAIWLQPDKKISLLQRWIKSYSKVGKICRWAHTVVVGNQYLADYANKFSHNVHIIPTVVDTTNLFIPAKTSLNNDPLVIGWTGSHTTLPYLENLEPVLLQLKKDFSFRLLVLANKEPQFKELDYRFVKWSEETEVNELRTIDIGIMPLPDDEWTKGKCGFKAIQYMALSKPAVVSAVGVNPDIVLHNKNGFTCLTSEDWLMALRRLMVNKNLRNEFGGAARQHVIANYSLHTAARKWCDILSVEG